MKRSRVSIPQSRSSFLSIQCKECGTQRVVFSASNTNLNCEKCNTLLLESTGGKALIHADILKRVD